MSFSRSLKKNPRLNSKKAADEIQQPLTVLVVDDEEIVLELACFLLEALGYTVKGTTSSVEALEIFKSDPNGIGLVISDFNMPIMGGQKLLENILTIRPDVPAIMCTGDSGIISEKEAGKIGFSSFLRKPFKKLDMIQAIEEALAEAGRT